MIKSWKTFMLEDKAADPKVKLTCWWSAWIEEEKSGVDQKLEINLIFGQFYTTSSCLFIYLFIF